MAHMTLDVEEDGTITVYMDDGKISACINLNYPSKKQAQDFLHNLESAIHDLWMEEYFPDE